MWQLCVKPLIKYHIDMETKTNNKVRHTQKNIKAFQMDKILAEVKRETSLSTTLT